jgi:GDSL-like Lipase/Acylhydrolase family
MSRIWKFRALALLTGLVAGTCLAALIWAGHRILSPTMSERSASEFAAMYSKLPTESRNLLDAAGYGRDDRLICTANFDGVLVFSGSVMRLDPMRGYRFKERQANLWVFPRGLPYQIPIPDTEEVRAVLNETGVAITSREEINSYGCRGPEWKDILEYDVRVLVVGDSFAEGILVPTEEVFPTRLQSELAARTGKKVLVANAGVIGYSTEQEFYTMSELVPQLRPDIVVLCFFANDVHRDHHEVLIKKNFNSAWEVAKEWLDRCVAYCRRQGIRFAVAVIPDRSQLSSRASRKRYQHRLEQIAYDLGIYLIDPDERFLSRRGESLYLQGDDHLSSAGHEVLAKILADHLMGWVSKD